MAPHELFVSKHLIEVAVQIGLVLEGRVHLVQEPGMEAIGELVPLVLLSVVNAVD